MVFDKTETSLEERPLTCVVSADAVEEEIKTIIDIVMLTVQRGALYALSENILQTILWSEKKIEKKGT